MWLVRWKSPSPLQTTSDRCTPGRATIAVYVQDALRGVDSTDGGGPGSTGKRALREFDNAPPFGETKLDAMRSCGGWGRSILAKRPAILENTVLLQPRPIKLFAVLKILTKLVYRG